MIMETTVLPFIKHAHMSGLMGCYLCINTLFNTSVISDFTESVRLVVNHTLCPIVGRG